MGFWKRFDEIAHIVGPALLALFGVPPSLVDLTTKSIVVVEDIAQAKEMTGEAKKALVLDAVRTAVSGVNAAAGKSLLVPDDVARVTGQAIDITIEAINAAQAAQAGVS